MDLPKLLECCRFCLNFVDLVDRAEISDEIKDSFKELTDIEVKRNCGCT